MPSTKPSLHPLKTPKSATFPSELHKSPLPGLTDIIKQEEGLKTPITPPVAYTDFLKALTPVLSSPMSAGVGFFSDKSSGKSTPTSQPSTASSTCFCHCENQKSPNVAVPPPSPFVYPRSARTPTSLRRLRIPQSPLYSPGADSPMSANMRSPYSPSDWMLEGNARYIDAPRSACIRPVNVRQVVTRTVTYKRTPLDPAPKGKRRKTNDS